MSIIEHVRRDGYVFLPSFKPERSGPEIATALGCPVALGDGPPVHRLISRERDDATPNTYSGLFGRDPFPFHTDLAHWRKPPRYLFLRCVVGYAEVPTLIADGRDIITVVGARTLSRALVQPRRPIAGALPLLRLYHQESDQSLVRWDETFIRPASASGTEGYSRFKKALDTAEGLSIALARSGDTLIIDNWRMLHARSAVPAACQDRCLERAYLEQVN